MGLYDWFAGAVNRITAKWNVDGTGYPGIASNTSAGIPIDRHTALTSATFFACQNLIGGTIATLGFEVMRERKSGSKEVVPNHPVHNIIRWEPTLHSTSAEFLQRFVWDQELSGNAYARISRLGKDVTGLVPWDPERVTPRVGGEPWQYEFKKQVGTPDVIDERDANGNCQVWHLKNVSSDGKLGISTPEIARQAIGLDLAVERYGSAFFGKGGRVKDIFKIDGPSPTAEQRDKFRGIFRESYGNVENFHEVLLLEKGMDLVGKSGATPNEAQFLETQIQNAIKVCRVCGVPPTMVGILDRATYSNNEQLMLQFVTIGLANRIERIEQSARRALFTAEEKAQGFYIHSRVNKLMRGDSVARSNYYKTMMSLGAMNAEEVRDLEDMPRIGTDEASQYRRAQNIFGPDEPADAGAQTTDQQASTGGAA